MTLCRPSQVVAAAALLAMASVVGCSTRAWGEGGIRLALMIPPTGPSVSSVAWQVTSAGHAVVRSGTVSTSDPNATAAVYTSCPAGSGYQVTLTATASDGSPCSGVSPPFNVATGAIAMVALDLVCGGGDPPQARSHVIIQATTIAGDYCPLLMSWNASALRATSGSR